MIAGEMAYREEDLPISQMDADPFGPRRPARGDISERLGFRRPSTAPMSAGVDDDPFARMLVPVGHDDISRLSRELDNQVPLFARRAHARERLAASGRLGLGIALIITFLMLSAISAFVAGALDVQIPPWFAPLGDFSQGVMASAAIIGLLVWFVLVAQSAQMMFEAMFLRSMSALSGLLLGATTAAVGIGAILVINPIVLLVASTVGLMGIAMVRAIGRIGDTE